jgi:hypothetical protein
MTRSKRANEGSAPRLPLFLARTALKPTGKVRLIDFTFRDLNHLLDDPHLRRC